MNLRKANFERHFTWNRSKIIDNDDARKWHTIKINELILSIIYYLYTHLMDYVYTNMYEILCLSVIYNIWEINFYRFFFCFAVSLEQDNLSTVNFNFLNVEKYFQTKPIWKKRSKPILYLRLYYLFFHYMYGVEYFTLIHVSWCNVFFSLWQSKIKLLLGREYLLWISNIFFILANFFISVFFS